MRVPFRPLPGNPVPLLYPLIRVSLGKKHAGRTRLFEAMIDSGSADCMFHASLLPSLGIKLDSGRKEERFGIGGKQEVWVHPIQLFVGSDLLSIEAAFTPSLLLGGLLGRNGFFEFYKVTFDPAPNPPELELERIYRA